MEKRIQILHLQDKATLITGIPPIQDKEYVRLKWQRLTKHSVSTKGKMFKSKAKRI